MNAPPDRFKVVDDTVVQFDDECFRITGMLNITARRVLLVAEREAERHSTIASDGRPPSAQGEVLFSHVDDDVQPLLWGDWLDRSNAFSSGPALSPPWIARVQQERLIARLEKIANDRPLGIANRLLILGPHGAGRRSAIGRLRDRHSSVTTDDASRVPMIYVGFWVSGQDFYESCVQQTSHDESLRCTP